MRSREDQTWFRTLRVLGAVCGAALVFLPLFIGIVTSLSSPDKIFQSPPDLLPLPPRWGNYVRVLGADGFGRYFVNSSIVATVATFLSVLADTMAGYAIAKLNFRGKPAVLLVLLATIMVPSEVTMIPLFVIFRSIPLLGGNDLFGRGGVGLLDSYPALILPSVASVFGTYLMRQYFLSLPTEMIHAARVDGLSEFQIFRRICLPMAKPAIVAVAIVGFTDTWNAFLWPLIVTSSAEMRTLQLGLGIYRGQYQVQWELLMAGTLISTLPVLLLFVLGQRYFVQGIAMSGMKG